jgi:hypothetical protein
VWKLVLTGAIFPTYSSDILAPFLGWRPGQLPGWSTLIPALVLFLPSFCSPVSVRVNTRDMAGRIGSPWMQSKAGCALDRPCTVQLGSGQANVRALLQNLSVPETQCCFVTRWSTTESSSFTLIIIWSSPGRFIIADISSQALSLRKIL